MSIFDYCDVICMHASATTLKPLDALYHRSLRFITGEKFLTHHCVLYQKVGWPPLAVRRQQHCLLFIYQALCGKLPNYLSSLLTVNNLNYRTRLQSHLRLSVPRVNTELGKTAFRFYAPDKWNRLQDSLKLEQLVSYQKAFPILVDKHLCFNCTCF